MAVVKSCMEKKSVPFYQDNIDRVHRVGTKYTDENTGKKIQSIIVYFESCKFRKSLMMLDQEIFINDNRKTGLNFFSVSFNLTRRRYLLLKTANGLMENNCNISFVCAGVNCSLGTKLKNGSFKYFNSLNELLRLFYLQSL